MENETQKQITALVAKINNIRNNAKFICDKLNDPKFMDLLWVANNEQKIEDLAKSLVGQSTSVVVATKSNHKSKRIKHNNAVMQQHSADYRKYLKQCEFTHTTPLKWTEWLKVNHPAKNGGSSMWYQTISNITP